jgi:hypothetical protein
MHVAPNMMVHAGTAQRSPRHAAAAHAATTSHKRRSALSSRPCCVPQTRQRPHLPDLALISHARFCPAHGCAAGRVAPLTAAGSAWQAASSPSGRGDAWQESTAWVNGGGPERAQRWARSATVPLFAPVLVVLRPTLVIRSPQRQGNHEGKQDGVGDVAPPALLDLPPQHGQVGGQEQQCPDAARCSTRSGTRRVGFGVRIAA